MKRDSESFDEMTEFFFMSLHVYFQIKDFKKNEIKNFIFLYDKATFMKLQKIDLPLTKYYGAWFTSASWISTLV